VFFLLTGVFFTQTDQKGEKWEPGNGYMECSGAHNYLYADREIGPGDFHIRARISLQQLDRTSSSFLLGEHSFGFDDATDLPLSHVLHQSRLTNSSRQPEMRKNLPLPLWVMQDLESVK
jgi:hypothetical protein